MNILLPDMHKNFTRSMCYVLGELLNYNIFIPDTSWATVIGYGDKWNLNKIETYFAKNPNVKTISWEEFKDSTIDIVMSPCIEQQADIIKNIIIPFQDRYKYVSYYGNEYVNGYIPWQYFKNHLSADLNSHIEAIHSGVHAARILPPIKYEDYPFKFNTTSMDINTYIHYYQYSWKSGYAMYQAIKEIFQQYKFRHYGKHGEEEIDELDMYSKITQSAATIHLKDREGYGMSVIESMASGRPIIGFRPVISTKRLAAWVTDNVSILFDSVEELSVKLDKFAIVDNRMELQHKCAEHIRNTIVPSEQAIIIKKFMENLV